MTIEDQIRDDMIADMINSKKLNPIVSELFIRGRKLVSMNIDKHGIFEYL